MTELTDADLYLCGIATLLASWEEYARGASGAAVRRLSGVAAAVFPQQPERTVYNNALLDRDLAAAERADALDALEAVYAAAGVTHFAAWVPDPRVRTGGPRVSGTSRWRTRSLAPNRGSEVGSQPALRRR